MVDSDSAKITLRHGFRSRGVRIQPALGGQSCTGGDKCELRRPKHGDFYGEPGYRFWVILRDGEPILALEQDEGLAWTRHHHTAFPLMTLYEESRRHLFVTALKLLRRVDQV